MIKKMLRMMVAVGLFAGISQAATYYVDASRPDDSGNAQSWSTAKQTIQAAVDLASDGDAVLVTNGVYDMGGAVTPGYSCMNRVVITNDMTLRSVNGSDVTFIQGSEASGGGNGSDAVRGVYLSAGLLSGFTVTNGYTQSWEGSYPYDMCGGGVYLYEGDGVVTNCVLAGNSATYYGGGSYYGMLKSSKPWKLRNALVLLLASGVGSRYVWNSFTEKDSMARSRYYSRRFGVRIESEGWR